MSAQVSWLRRVWDTPLLNYYVILGVTMTLTLIGLTMVLSSSMVTSYANGSSVFSEFIKQSIIVVIGCIAMLITLRMRPATIQRLAPVLLAGAFLLLFAVLIPGVGVGGEEVGSNSWIRVGPIGIQPSEIAKLALAVWGSSVVSRAVRKSNSAKSLGPFALAAVVVLALVLAQKDLGMMLALAVVVGAIVFFAGVRNIVLVFAGALLAVLGTITIISQSFRSARIATWVDALTLQFDEETTRGSAFQSYQGILSLSDGGFFGAGLGQSSAKWGFLPEATNDFIFAIIGEELGFLGTGLVITLFAALGYFGMRTAMNQADPFLRMMAATLTIGVVVQAFYNMGYVLGLLPVTGIQLPLISAGGSSAVVTLMTLGLLANCARHEPQAISSMQHEGRPLFDRILGLPEPEPYVAGQHLREERRQRAQHFAPQPDRSPRVITQPTPRQRHLSQDERLDRDRTSRARRRTGVVESPQRYDRDRRQALPEHRGQRNAQDRRYRK